MADLLKRWYPDIVRKGELVVDSSTGCIYHGDDSTAGGIQVTPDPSTGNYAAKGCSIVGTVSNAIAMGGAYQTTYVASATAQRQSSPISADSAYADAVAAGIPANVTTTFGYDHINNQIGGTISGGGHNLLYSGYSAGDGYHGSHGVVCGGSFNEIRSGQYSTILGGTQNYVAGNYMVMGGFSNAATSSRQNYGTFCWGISNNLTAKTRYSVVMAQSGTIAANPSTTTLDHVYLTGFQPVAKSLYSKIHGCYTFAAAGDRQLGTYNLGRSLSNATASRLTSDTTGTSGLIYIPDNTLWACTMMIVGVSDDHSKYHAEVIEFAVHKQAATTAAILGTPVQRVLAADSAGETYTVTVTVKNDLGTPADSWIDIKVASHSSVTMRWHARIETAEVAF